jgi:hypothetical protein
MTIWFRSLISDIAAFCDVCIDRELAVELLDLEPQRHLLLP